MSSYVWIWKTRSVTLEKLPSQSHPGAARSFEGRYLFRVRKRHVNESFVAVKKPCWVFPAGLSYNTVDRSWLPGRDRHGSLKRLNEETQLRILSWIQHRWWRASAECFGVFVAPHLSLIQEILPKVHHSDHALKNGRGCSSLALGPASIL